MFRSRDEKRRLSYRVSLPLLVISSMASLFYLFFRKHCTLMTTLDMGKIYSNHLHFLSYWLKFPVDNTELQRHFRAPKFLGEACPRRWSPLLWSAFSVPTFFLCVHLQNLKLRPSNLYESRKLASHNSCIRWFLKWAIINLELLWFRCKLGKLETELTILKIHAQESSIASVSSITLEFLNVNGPASFR